MRGRLRSSGTRARGTPLRVAALLAALSLGVARPARAQNLDAHATTNENTRWYSLGILTGSIRLDPALANYQWDVTPRLAWGGQVMAGEGRWALGPRVLATQTTQGSGVSGTSGPVVHATSWELVGNARLAKPLGVELLALGSSGLLHLGYQPDQMTLDVSGTPVVVDFHPIDEWIGGAGLAARRELVGPWRAGLEGEWRRFSMDTAHRNGSVIETQRQSFDDWSIRLELARRFGR
jgi:hypothetical protein